MIYVPLIYFSLLFVYLTTKSRTFNVGSMIVIYYIISSFFAILIKINDYWTYGAFPKLDIVPTVLYCILLTLAILPFYYFKSDKIDVVKLDNPKLFLIISWILIILSFSSLIVSFDKIASVSFDDFNDIRKEFYADSGVFEKSTETVWYQYILGFAPAFSPIMLLFFFYSITFMDNKLLFNTLLYLSSVIIVLFSVTSAARTQVVYWLMTFSVLYVCFYKKMSKRTRRIVNIYFVVVAAAGATYMISVTESRFGYRIDGAEGGFVSYAGQSYLQFCNVYNHYTFNDITVDRTFPITSKYILRHRFTNVEYRATQSIRIGAETGVFFTFLGDAMLDYGKFGMVVYVMIFYILANKILRRRNVKSISLSQMMIFTLLIRVPLLGLFAYMYCSISSSVLIIGSITISYLLIPQKTQYEKNNYFLHYRNL